MNPVVSVSSGAHEGSQQTLREVLYRSREHVGATLIKTFLTATIVGVAYEGAKRLAFPHITLWQSEAITVCLLGAASTVAAYLILSRRSEHLAQLQMQSVERKQAEERMRQTAEALKTLVQASPLAIIVVDRSLIVRRWNPAAERLLGWSEAELLSKPLPAIPEARRGAFRAMLEKVLQGGTAEPHTTQRVRKDGCLVDVISSTALLRDASGEITGFLSVLTDITERKRAEEALQESEARFRTLIEKAPVAIGIGRNGLNIYANQKYLDMFAFQSASELVGRPIAEHWAPEYQALIGERAQQRSRGIEVPESYEAVGQRRDGSRFPVQINTTIANLPDGPATLAFLSDITEQRRAQEALVRLRQAVEASGEVVFITDPESIFTFVNPEFTRLYGYTEAEVVGKVTPRILSSATQPASKYAEFQKTLVAKRVARGQVVMKAKDGRLLTIHSSVSPILDDAGNITGFLAIQRDMTERKRLEEQFLQAQKMEAVGRLAAGVAHDFNNLLTIINGHSGLMLRRLSSENPAWDSFAEIKDAGERAAGLTRQLLAFSRQQVRKSTVLNLNTLVTNSIKMLRRLIGEDIELVFNAVPELGMVCADAGQIEQILMNLAVNSRDAMPKGGRLTIETSNLLADEASGTAPYVQPGAYVMLTVSDTGCGMDAETQSRIFEPFFTTKGQGKGTGLGLATVYGIIKQSGGYIWVSSEVGKGTTFRIYLPVVEGVPETAEVHGAGSGGSETVLLVEDEAKLRSLVRRVLETEGYLVLEALDCMEALLIASRHKGHIHMLLTDVVMPVMSGCELAERLAKRRPEMKILYMSGYTDDRIFRHGILESGVAFLQKPFAPESLAHKVREVLDA